MRSSVSRARARRRAPNVWMIVVQRLLQAGDPLVARDRADALDGGPAHVVLGMRGQPAQRGNRRGRAERRERPARELQPRRAEPRRDGAHRRVRRRIEHPAQRRDRLRLQLDDDRRPLEMEAERLARSLEGRDRARRQRRARDGPQRSGPIEGVDPERRLERERLDLGAAVPHGEHRVLGERAEGSERDLRRQQLHDQRVGRRLDDRRMEV
jgi:hypothetical protein